MKINVGPETVRGGGGGGARGEDAGGGGGVQTPCDS